MTSTHTAQERRTAVSRQRILDAAVACLVEQGYAGASTLQIQERAGVSRGRLLHHFPSRDELLVAAAEHLAATQVTALRDSSAIEAPDGDPARIDQAVEQMWETFHQPYFWAAMELWLAARHNADIRTILGPMEQDLYRSIRRTVAAMFGPVYAARPRFHLVLDLLVSSMRGVALTYGFSGRSPEGDPHLAQWRQLAHALLEP